jgi:hypothetical protein
MGFPNNKITNGLSGGKYIASTFQHTGDWIAIQVLADAKFHTLTGNISGNFDAAFASVVEANAAIVPAGTTLFGKFTAIKLHSGRVIAYNA